MIVGSNSLRASFQLLLLIIIFTGSCLLIELAIFAKTVRAGWHSFC
ncbi:MAG: hypothetical protein H9Q66_03455 [Spiroplasma ixodetis]|nr:hypothetical protein [Spiroplasma ixodetis]